MSAIHNLNDFQKAIDQTMLDWNKQILKGNLFKINLLLLESIFVDYFESKTAIKYLVNIKKDSEGNVYLIPFDAKMINQIYQAILDFNKNWQIAIQGESIVLSLPMITTQKKDLIIKDWKIKTENYRVKIRNYRHAFINYLKNEQKMNKEELTTEQKKIQKIMDDNNHNMEKILKEKINELLQS